MTHTMFHLLCVWKMRMEVGKCYSDAKRRGRRIPFDYEEPKSGLEGWEQLWEIGCTVRYLLFSTFVKLVKIAGGFRRTCSLQSSIKGEAQRHIGIQGCLHRHLAETCLPCEVHTM